MSGWLSDNFRKSRPGGKRAQGGTRGRRHALPLGIESLEERMLLSFSPQLMGDLVPGPVGSSPGQFVGCGGTTYFVANDGTGGSALWKTDGTAAGTSLVKDFNGAG